MDCAWKILSVHTNLRKVSLGLSSGIKGTRKSYSEPGLANLHGLFWTQIQHSAFCRAHMSVPQPRPKAIIKLFFNVRGMHCSLLSKRPYSWLEIQLYVNKDKTPELLAMHSWCTCKWGTIIRNAHGRAPLGVFSTQHFALFLVCHPTAETVQSCPITARKFVRCFFTAFVIPNRLSKEVME